MFDLAKALNKSTQNTQPKILTSHALHAVQGCTLLFQTEECKNLVQEIFLFEGWNQPTFIKETVGQKKFSGNELNEIILLELNQSTDVVEDARRFASQIPTHKGVIVIGKEDAISTLRSLKDMGFYYVYWPVNKQEFADFLQHVNNNLQSYSGVSKKRKAKSVAVVGTKGGIGTSLISTELASTLSGRGADTILVDHQYVDSNIDILLGLKDFQRHSIAEITIPIHELDDESAASLLLKVRNNFRLLALDGDDIDNHILAFNHTLCDLLSRNANFIIEDFSGSNDFRLDPIKLVERNDTVIIVLEPSISSVRNSRNIINKINDFQVSESNQTRIIVVMNSHRPDSAFPLNNKEVSEYLRHTVDIEINFNKSVNSIILEGKRPHKHDKQLEFAFTKLARLINGQTTEKESAVSKLKRLLKR